ncbi:MAG: cytochrome c biogenesis protein CcdA [candidate division Zixibacteria bacterium]
MIETLRQIVDSPEYGWIILPASLVLGLAASVSSCCTLPVLGAIAGYSGTRDQIDKKTIAVTGLFFMIGTMLALGLLGAATGFISQLAGSALGKYWKVFAGLIIVVLGAASLDLIPWKIPGIVSNYKPTVPDSIKGAAVFGLVVGGGTSACTVGCNPALAGAIGMAVLRGHTLWGIIILAFFAIGYSFPVAAVLTGLSYGKAAIFRSERAAKIIRYTAGCILLIAGFYLLIF